MATMIKTVQCDDNVKKEQCVLIDTADDNDDLVIVID
jgi:hypothetical protein